jgi:UDP-glucose 4-epimerase
VHGDGLQSRDFTFISDVVGANLAAAAAPAERCAGHAYNVAGGTAASLLDVLQILADLLGVTPDPEFVESRAGDVRHSRADASAAARDLGFTTEVELADGLQQTVDWLRTLS